MGILLRLTGDGCMLCRRRAKGHPVRCPEDPDSNFEGGKSLSQMPDDAGPSTTPVYIHGFEKASEPFIFLNSRFDEHMKHISNSVNGIFTVEKKVGEGRRCY